MTTASSIESRNQKAESRNQVPAGGGFLLFRKRKNVRDLVIGIAIILIIAGVASHMPGRYRYYSVLHGRVVGDQDAG